MLSRLTGQARSFGHVVLCLFVLLLYVACGSSNTSAREYDQEPISQEYSPTDGGVAQESFTESTTSPEFPDAGSPKEDQPESFPSEPSAESGAEQIPEPLGPAGLCKQIAQTMCEAMTRCCLTSAMLQDPALAAKFRFKNKEECEQSLQNRCLTQDFEKEKEAYEDGMMKVSEQKLQDCLGALREVDKDCKRPDANTYRHSCGAIFQDNAAVGRNCESKLTDCACADGLGVCYPDGKGDSICQSWGSKDESCKELPCLQSFVCAPSAQGPVCSSPLSQNDACTTSVQCQKGLACIGQSCQPPLKEGQPCESAEQCGEKLTCHPTLKRCVARSTNDECRYASHCAAGYVCFGLKPGPFQCQKPALQGAPCSDPEACDAGLRCVSGKCAALPGQDEACSVSEGCKSPLLCDPGTSKCVKAPVDGEDCLSGAKPCGEGFACFVEQNGRKCRARKDKDGACGEDAQCKAGLGCIGQKCQSLPVAQEACHGEEHCAEGHYCDLSVSPRMCTKAKEEGKGCPVGNECADGLVCLPNARGQKECQKLPKEGDSCRLRCDAGLVCLPSTQPGKCIPSLCSDALNAER